jgi:hypothetical protein
MAGAPKGNNNAGKNKVWSEALRKEIVQGDNLPKLARALIAKATEGDVAALREIGDRLEGKPNQSITGANDTPLYPPIIQFVLDEDTPDETAA